MPAAFCILLYQYSSTALLRRSDDSAQKAHAPISKGSRSTRHCGFAGGAPRCLDIPDDFRLACIFIVVSLGMPPASPLFLCTIIIIPHAPASHADGAGFRQGGWRRRGRQAMIRAERDTGSRRHAFSFRACCLIAITGDKTQRLHFFDTRFRLFVISADGDAIHISSRRKMMGQENKPAHY